jgi:hypothetical protein
LTTIPKNSSLDAQLIGQPIRNRLRYKHLQEDPYQQIYQEYLAAFEFIGAEPVKIEKAHFTKQLEKKVKEWILRTGKQPDLYVRIEHGKPQIKIRELS